MNKHNEYVVNKNLKHFDDISFLENFRQNAFFFNKQRFARS
jgi:hypothetical protein